MLRTMLGTLLGLLLLLGPTAPAQAQLASGTRAPDFKTMGMLGDQRFRVHLAEQLRHGPVVLYFFPKAFTKGCTLESKAFADAMPRFKAAGAQVIGLSTDNLDTLARFSTEVCRSKVPMAHASPALLAAYDVELAGIGAVVPVADRTSYVIAPDGTVAMVHSEMDYADHVAKTLQAVEDLSRR
ncbi:peroxiredoxin [Sphingomicrobium astaxanthinifaciens]|uniref:peroxiredoxin n=1 Tax=Sphingomicrobium astaxanthinifaciens TaxID=1227949 RepID=UPI001FCC2D6F|nr:redoxin domain-containing protein [Sphingomicrobium astaxanthinifaciens]MCJ7421250.1 redoxin domain-containing protein [Sphingomicrobium astaxanthinifaciens]